MILPRFSMGIGDRFAREGEAQLAAFAQAQSQGVTIAPVWNKSFREHSIIHSDPSEVRTEADTAVKALAWRQPYFVDADHIGLRTVDGFLSASDFYTLDVADFIGKACAGEQVRSFAVRHAPASGSLHLPGVERPFAVTRAEVEAIAAKYLYAVQEAGRIYRHIEKAKGAGSFVTEISMDETDKPQTPLELWFILAAIAEEAIPVQTIAPKFSGRFNKGVDFVGQLDLFEREFGDDLRVISFAVKEFGLPANLKLSVHSGSDKFSLYRPIHQVVQKTGAGLHLKTAGTTWLEEVTGLAEAGAEGLRLAKDLYLGALGRYDELAAPYASVIDIDPKKLPGAAQIEGWTGRQFVDALDHNPTCAAFNPSLRQLLHVGYKVAAEMGARFLSALEEHREIIGKRVTRNLFEKHIHPLFLEES